MAPSSASTRGLGVGWLLLSSKGLEGTVPCRYLHTMLAHAMLVEMPISTLRNRRMSQGMGRCVRFPRTLDVPRTLGVPRNLDVDKCSVQSSKYKKGGHPRLWALSFQPLKSWFNHLLIHHSFKALDFPA